MAGAGRFFRRRLALARNKFATLPGLLPGGVAIQFFDHNCSFERVCKLNDLSNDTVQADYVKVPSDLYQQILEELEKYRRLMDDYNDLKGIELPARKVAIGRDPETARYEAWLR